MWRVLQGGHVEGLTGWTGAPVEVPPVLKNKGIFLDLDPSTKCSLKMGYH